MQLMFWMAVLGLVGIFIWIIYQAYKLKGA